MSFAGDPNMGISRKPLPVMPTPIDGEFLNEVLEELDSVRVDSRHERRKFSRQVYRSMNVVLIAKEAGGEIAFMAASRNLSRGGISILHRQMMYPKDRCRLVLPLQEGKRMLVSAQIVRCRHVRGITHEIGIRFDRPISASDLEDLRKQDRPVAVTPDRSN
jgi:hypothetical protein